MTNQISARLRAMIPSGRALTVSERFDVTETAIQAADHIDAQAATIKALVDALEWYRLQVMRYGTSGLADAKEAAGLLDYDSGQRAAAALSAAKEPT